MSGIDVLVTERLILSRLSPEDAPFILELVNEPGWLRFIGDRGVNDLKGAQGYIEKVQQMYGLLGFGLYKVSLKSDRQALGLCGLLKRDALPDVDIGFALLARHSGRGYAREAAVATLEHGRRIFGIRRVLAITNPDNERSQVLLGKLGFVFERQVQMDGPSMYTHVYALEMP